VCGIGYQTLLSLICDILNVEINIKLVQDYGYLTIYLSEVSLIVSFESAMFSNLRKLLL
jgi:hypothetical protein